MFGWFDILKDEFQMKIYDANGIQEYVTLGYITQEQADEITGKNASTTAQPASSAPASSNNVESYNADKSLQASPETQKSEPSPNESTLNSEVHSDSNVASNASN